MARIYEKVGSGSVSVLLKGVVVSTSVWKQSTFLDMDIDILNSDQKIQAKTVGPSRILGWHTLRIDKRGCF